MGHHGIAERGDVHALAERLLREFGGDFRIVEHDRDDRVFAGQRFQPDPLQPGAEMRSIGEQSFARRAVFRDVQRLQRAADHGGRDGVGKEIGARTLAQQRDHFLLRGGIAAARPAQRLAQRAGGDVHPVHAAAEFMRAAPGRAEEAGGVAIVEMDDRAVFLGQVADLVEPGDIAVHREHAVGGDHLEARARGVGGLKLCLQVRHVVVLVAIALRLAEPHAVDDAGVVELVGNDRVFGAQQHFEQAPVGIEAGRVEDRVLEAEEPAEARFGFLVQVLRAADEAHRRHAVAMGVEPFARRIAQPLVARQPEVVVGAQVDDAALAQRDLRPLRRGNLPLVLGQARFLDILKFAGEVVVEFRVHQMSSQFSTTLVADPSSMAAKPFSNSAAGRRWVMIGVRSSPLSMKTDILYQVSKISRP